MGRIWRGIIGLEPYFLKLQHQVVEGW